MTAIFGPNDSRYSEATARWDTYAMPVIQVVVEPAEEADIPEIVKYCNENSIEFLAINRGHGSPASLGWFNGIQINMANLRNINIQPDGESAWFQGGVYDGQVTRYLWERGYVTPTGACDCVGVMGAGLGGGHGRLEGPYGMVSDNIIQLNVVLSNGDWIQVNSTSHSDLLWAMKGAGHNFGIVTSFESKIYPRGPDTWHYHNYVWKGDKLEDVFNALNVFHNNGSTPVNMTVNFGNFYINTTITKTEPIIQWTFGYRGTAAEAEKILAPFNAIESISDEQGDVPYPQVADVQATGENDAICQDGTIRITGTAGLQVYNVTAERQIFNTYAKRIAEKPELAAGGIILHEGYSTEAVDKYSSDESAYPFRADHHLMLFQGLLEPNSSYEKDAWEWAAEVIDIWNAGQPERQPNAYVNYANGYEPIEQWYGHEEWRIKRLTDLKSKYDPTNRFRYFNPIVSHSQNKKPW
ncbi:putative FAD-linked oxidoreductase YvdP [Talaromyces islandicus]|uniref:Putative FAD-linked oxidoreductase YvdP n=1 Tax=Talaromyces islandicus TaxID=28573 RepID=A0A0U1MAT8_TALIS|nr:putative FAD-linked oxidoreductase YvdP [Talaromyces islandicus]